VLVCWTLLIMHCHHVSSTADSSASDILPFSEVAPKPAQEEVIFHPTPQQQPQVLAAGELTHLLLMLPGPAHTNPSRTARQH
jgi:hypothetical protein